MNYMSERMENSKQYTNVPCAPQKDRIKLRFCEICLDFDELSRFYNTN